MSMSARTSSTALKGLDLTEICITSGGELVEVPTAACRPAPSRLPDVAGVGVVPVLADGEKCARCWQVLEEVGKSAGIRCSASAAKGR